MLLLPRSVFLLIDSPVCLNVAADLYHYLISEISDALVPPRYSCDLSELSMGSQVTINCLGLIF